MWNLKYDTNDSVSEIETELEKTETGLNTEPTGGCQAGRFRRRME